MSPLQEDCGLVEWVNHTAPLRPALHKIYTAEGLTDKAMNAKIKALYDKHQVGPLLFVMMQSACCMGLCLALHKV